MTVIIWFRYDASYVPWKQSCSLQLPLLHIIGFKLKKKETKMDTRKTKFLGEKTNQLIWEEKNEVLPR